jgi:hypothetical protein
VRRNPGSVNVPLSTSGTSATCEAVRLADDGEPVKPAAEANRTEDPVQPPAPARRKEVRPWIIPGSPINSYSDSELASLAQWIRSDDVLRTEDELLDEMMRELGFQKRGRNIVARLTDAIICSRPPER